MNDRPSKSASPYPDSVNRLIDEFSKLPGIGRRSAERLAFYLLKSSPDDALALSRAISDIKTSVRQCSVCFNLCEADVCPICSDENRDRTQVLVVEQPKDLIALEHTGMYRGLYHVLMGRISPLEGVAPGDLTVGELFARVEAPDNNPGAVKITDVVLGLNPNLEGDGTALYLARELRTRGVTVTRLARGLPSGSQLEYASKAVLADALSGRQSMD